MQIRVPGALALALLIMVTSCYSEKDYPMSPDDYASYMEPLALSSATVPATGVSRVRIEAVLRDPGKNHVIVFSSTAGTFEGGTNSSIEVAVGERGRAVAELLSPTQPGIARIDAKVKAVPQITRSTEIRFTAPVIDDLIRFENVPDSVVADGVTSTRIAVATSKDLFNGQRRISFRTSRGSFAESGSATADVLVSQEGVTLIHLTSPDQMGFTTVSASVNGFTREVTIPVTRALPDGVVVDAGAFRMETGREYTVVARLRRDRGRVTPGLPVEFAAVDTTNHPIGSFRAVSPSNSTGEASAIYSPLRTSYRGPITLRAHVLGSPVVGVAEVEIVSP